MQSVLQDVLCFEQECYVIDCKWLSPEGEQNKRGENDRRKRTPEKKKIPLAAIDPVDPVSWQACSPAQIPADSRERTEGQSTRSGEAANRA